jgi:hypothetical protein
MIKGFDKVRSAGIPFAQLLTSIVLSLMVYSMVPQGALGQQERSKSAPMRPQPDPCRLLSSAEIERVQGERVVENKYSQQEARTFLLRTCFYRTADFTKSLSLALAVPNPASARPEGPREYWREHFPEAGTSSNGRVTEERKRETKQEEAERGIKPVEVSGLGEQADWIPNPHVGTLYVLQGNYFLRISLGGTDADAVRSKKAQDLARAALKRLNPASGPK